MALSTYQLLNLEVILLFCMRFIYSQILVILLPPNPSTVTSPSILYFFKSDFASTQVLIAITSCLVIPPPRVLPDHSLYWNQSDLKIFSDFFFFLNHLLVSSTMSLHTPNNVLPDLGTNCTQPLSRPPFWPQPCWASQDMPSPFRPCRLLVCCSLYLELAHPTFPFSLISSCQF